MSMNLNLEATQKATLGKTGKEITVTETFSLKQTPTSVTDRCINSPSPLETYIKWIYEEFGDEPEVYPIYGEGDVVCGLKKVYFARDHERDLREWVKKKEEDGFVVRFYSM